jgi:hypothetical protein
MKIIREQKITAADLAAAVVGAPAPTRAGVCLR